MICESCGSPKIQEKTIEGYEVSECQVCGALYGDGEAIRKIREVQEAKGVSIDPFVYPLYKIIQNVPSFRVDSACPGYPEENVAPFVSWNVDEDTLRDLAKFACALEEVNQVTKLHWSLETTFNKEILFVLKPMFHCDPCYISAEQISLAQKDLHILTEKLGSKLRS